MPLGGNEEVTGSHKGIWIWYAVNCSVPFFSMGVTSDHCCTFRIKQESAMDLWQSIGFLVILRQSADIFRIPWKL